MSFICWYTSGASGSPPSRSHKSGIRGTQGSDLVSSRLRQWGSDKPRGARSGRLRSTRLPPASRTFCLETSATVTAFAPTFGTKGSLVLFRRSCVSALVQIGHGYPRSTSFCTSTSATVTAFAPTFGTKGSLVLFRRSCVSERSDDPDSRVAFEGSDACLECLKPFSRCCVGWVARNKAKGANLVNRAWRLPARSLVLRTCINTPPLFSLVFICPAGPHADKGAATETRQGFSALDPLKFMRLSVRVRLLEPPCLAVLKSRSSGSGLLHGSRGSLG